MKKLPAINAGITALIISLCSVVPSGAQTKYFAQPQGTTVKIDGTSTAHDWEMAGTIVGGYVEFEAGVKLDPAQASIVGITDGKVPARVHALIPVQSVHSKAEHAPDIMDHLMQKTLNVDQFPRIEYSLTEMTFKGPHVAGKPFEFDTTGDLSIAGVTNKVSFPVTIEVVEAGKIRVSAAVPLKMTAFKVDPPAPNIGLGLMRCGDDIKILIDWTLKER